jgi:hypothetical protein
MLKSGNSRKKKSNGSLDDWRERMAKAWFAIIKNQDKYFLALESEKMMYLRGTLSEAITDFPNAYKKESKAAGSSESLIELLHFKPSIVYLSIDDLEKKLFNIENGVNNYILQTEAGTISAWECNGPADLEEIYQRGISYSAFNKKNIGDN